MASFKCCKGCVPPKRSFDCHTYCKDYKDEKKQHEDKKEKIKAYINEYPTLSGYDFNESVRERNPRRTKSKHR